MTTKPCRVPNFKKYSLRRADGEYRTGGQRDRRTQMFSFIETERGMELKIRQDIKKKKRIETPLLFKKQVWAPIK